LMEFLSSITTSITESIVQIFPLSNIP
jgi:hypothetical protein